MSPCQWLVLGMLSAVIMAMLVVWPLLAVSSRESEREERAEMARQELESNGKL